MSAIFLSHSSSDNALAMAVARRLAERGHHSVFLDLDPEKGIVGGQSWERTLYRKLRACRTVVALCTDPYLRSHWCFAEIALARMEGKPIVALQAEPLAADAQLPAILMDRQLIDLRRDAEDGYRRLWRALGALDLDGGPSDWDPATPPYLGLDAYQEAHAPVFFGREEESLAGLELLERGAPGLIMVLGASGSGKSSLVRAGMLPRLRARGERWLVVDPFRPGRDPAAELLESLVRAYGRYARDHVDAAGGPERLRQQLQARWDAAPGGAPGAVQGQAEPPPPAAAAAADARPPGDERLQRLLELLQRLRDDPPAALPDRLRNHLDWSLDDLRRLCHADAPAPGPAGGTQPLVEIADALRRAAGRRDARVLIVIDQFEELLGQGQTGGAVRHWLALLRAAIEAEHSPLTVLATMRSDFLAQFQRHPALQGIDFESLSLGPMRSEGMRRVIRMPARLAAVEIDEGLTERLLEDTGTPDALPLLSFTLWVMYRDRRDPGRLTLAEYERLGGLQGTVSREADAVLAAAARAHKEGALRTALLQLARLGEDGSYARLAVDWDRPEIQPARELLAQLVERRVLVSRMEGEVPVVEVAHEALFRAWQPLRTWLDTARAELLLRRQLERDAAAWHEGGRAAELLWRSGRLLQARDLVGRSLRGRHDAVAEFVRAGVRRQRRVRVALAVSGAALFGVLTLALGIALYQRNQARQEKVRSLDLARVAVAGEWLARDPTLAALVLLEVEDPAATRFLARRVGEVLQQGLVAAEYPHDGPVHGVAISADGTRVLTLSGKQARVWEARTGRLLCTLRHDETVVAGAFDPTGRHVLARAGTVGEQYVGDAPGRRAWVSDLGRCRVHFAVQHEAALGIARFSPDGQVLAAAWDDGTVRLYDVASGAAQPLPKHDPAVTALAFGPAGRSLAIASGATARLWTMASAEPHGAALAHEAGIWDVAYSPDGRLVATAGPGGTRLWDARTGEPGHVLAQDGVGHVEFSPDGRRLVAAGRDQAMVWNVASGQRAFKDPIVHTGLHHTSFSADGAYVITAPGHAGRRGYGNPRADDTVRYWHADSGEPGVTRRLTHALEPLTLAFAPDRGHVVANAARRSAAGRFETLSEDATARLWNVAPGDRRLWHALEHAHDVRSAAFSPDGSRVLAVAGPAVRWWDTASGEPRGELVHAQAARSAEWAADGRLIVSAAEDGTARLTDAQTGGVEFEARHAQPVQQAVLVAGGNLLATLSGPTLRLWRVGGGHAEIGSELFSLPYPGDRIAAEGISPDGRWIAVRSERTVQVWDVAQRRPAFPPLRHEGWARTAVFIDGGRQLVTGADENLARIWNVQDGTLKHALEHPAAVHQVAVAPDGRTVLTVADDGLVRLWDSRSGTARATLTHGCGVRAGGFSARGALAVSQSPDDRFRTECAAKLVVWDAASGAPRASIDLSSAEDAALSPDGTRVLAIQRGDGAATAWRHAEPHVVVFDADTGERRTAPYATPERLRDAVFSPDGRLLMTVSGRTVRLWPVSGELLQAVIARATRVCLTPAFRQQNLGEAPAAAQQKYAACERGHGRRVAPPPSEAPSAARLR